MSLTLQPVAEATVDFLNQLLEHRPLEKVSIRLWDGTLWPDEKPRAATVVLNHPGALRGMLAAGTAKGLGEAYLRDDFDVEGDMEEAVELAVALENRPTGWLASLTNYYKLHRLPASLRESLPGEKTRIEKDGRRHSLSRDRAAISFHYDVSNDFYRLWLDQEMVYSCGYFETPDATLDAAQLAKFRHLCRKLRLRRGQRLLDIGCGWGGLARYAAYNFGVEVVGVTLSEQQAEFARQRVEEAGLTEQVKIELRDYRQLRVEEGFDAIVSVGMAEHVGRENLTDYFKTVRALLRPGGVFLNHAIGEGRQAERFHGPSFVDAYVFPDADVPPIPLVLQSAEAAGFEVRDVENLREHYALTLRHWVRRLEATQGRAVTLVGESSYRVWRLYLAASAHGFGHGDIAIYQTLLSKPHADGRADLPLTRQDWYEK
ncbi:MAG TPA: cyclopropane-fatty-acyl-phospholipid synthase family protein [Lacunisphaera sp.]|jgi:cyclopropane-fatty-acyl-phospholipid synthase